jgi:uncharacterized protein YycO
MQTVRVIFTRSRNLGSFFIRLFTWSTWSHVGIVDGEYVIEAVWPKVRRVRIDKFLEGKSNWRIDQFACANKQAIIDAAKSQLGKPYDIGAVIGFLFRSNWQDDDKWFCSEILAWAFDKGGTPLFRPKRLRRVRPEHLWMIAPAK